MHTTEILALLDEISSKIPGATASTTEKEKATAAISRLKRTLQSDKPEKKIILETGQEILLHLRPLKELIPLFKTAWVAIKNLH